LPVHSQILEGWNESAVLLGFHPQEVAQHSVGGKLPLTIYESNYEVDDTKAENDGEDKKMEDGDSTLKLRFREVPYSVETDETEMISMNYVASGGGNAAASAPAPTAKDERPARSIESNGKGKRRLVESDIEEKKEAPLDDATVLTREEDEMLASLTAKANAIKMLHSRIQLITTYLERLPPSYTGGDGQEAESMDTDSNNTTPSLNIIRQIQALVSRLDLVIPSDREAFEKEVQSETNNVHLLGLLNSIMQGVNQARDVGKKFHAIESSKGSSARRGTVDYSASPFNVPGTGDLLV
jgi:COP9 signalosome complex subunit 6